MEILLLNKKTIIFLKMDVKCSLVNSLSPEPEIFILRRLLVGGSSSRWRSKLKMKVR